MTNGRARSFQDKGGRIPHPVSVSTIASAGHARRHRHCSGQYVTFLSDFGAGSDGFCCCPAVAYVTASGSPWSPILGVESPTKRVSPIVPPIKKTNDHREERGIMAHRCVFFLCSVERKITTTITPTSIDFLLWFGSGRERGDDGHYVWCPHFLENITLLANTQTHARTNTQTHQKHPAHHSSLDGTGFLFSFSVDAVRCASFFSFLFLPAVRSGTQKQMGGGRGRGASLRNAV